MVQDSPEIHKWAAALIALAEASQDLKGVEQDLANVVELVEQTEELRRFIADSQITSEGKAWALQKILGGRIRALLLHFLIILQEHCQLANLRTIAKTFFAQVASMRNRVRGEIVSARPLSTDMLRQIEQEVSRILDKDVYLHPLVDESVLGGVRVRVGDFILDGTIEHDLKALAKCLGV